MIKKIFPYIIVVILTQVVSISCLSDNKNKEASANDMSLSSEKNKVRLSLITVDNEQLDAYNAYLKEEIETSMELEPGVLLLYAVSEKEFPHKIVILEIYADEEAYQKHIKTPHFIKYKEGTLNMVQALELIDTNPLIPGLKMK